MFYIATYKGFVGEKANTVNVRLAKNFESFDQADKFAKIVCKFHCYAVLKSCH